MDIAIALMILAFVGSSIALARLYRTLKPNRKWVTAIVGSAIFVLIGICFGVYVGMPAQGILSLALILALNGIIAFLIAAAINLRRR